MRRKKPLPLVFLQVGLVTRLAVGLLSLVLHLSGYGSELTAAEPEPEMIEEEPEPVLSGSLSIGDSGWKEYEEDGVRALHGVDISEHQSEVDWAALRAAGVDFAMIRAGYRGYTDGGLFEDAHFRDNVLAAQAAGLEVGVYFFSQAITEEEAEEEARFLLRAVSGLQLSWPVAFDWESVAAEARTDGLSGREMTACALAFCRVIREAGLIPAIYANQQQGLLYYGYAEQELADVVFWLADYNETPAFRFPFQMWQYTDSGRLDGVSGSIDLNLSLTDFRKPR